MKFTDKMLIGYTVPSRACKDYLWNLCPHFREWQLYDDEGALAVTVQTLPGDSGFSPFVYRKDWEGADLQMFEFPTERDVINFVEGYLRGVMS